MTRELRFTTQNLGIDNQSEDCFIDPSDPIHSVKAQALMGTLTSGALNMAYDAHKRREIQTQHFQLRDEAKRLGIRPGTPAWHALNQSR